MGLCERAGYVTVQTDDDDNTNNEGLIPLVLCVASDLDDELGNESDNELSENESIDNQNDNDDENEVVIPPKDKNINLKFLYVVKKLDTSLNKEALKIFKEMTIHEAL